MSRLIDADELIKYIKIWEIGTSISSDQKEFIDCVNRQLTAFDAEKVTESLMDRFRVVSNDEDLEWNRAKQIDNGEWIEGSLIDLDIDNGYCYIVPPYKKASILPIIFLITDRMKLVDPETLCQFTGLCDKNGNKIWKNDILMCHGNPKDLVKAAFGEFGVRNIETGSIVDKVVGWHYEVVPTDAISRCEPFCWPMPLTEYYIERCEMEVVGNIFDNKELLQEVPE